MSTPFGFTLVFSVCWFFVILWVYPEGVAFDLGLPTMPSDDHFCPIWFFDIDDGYPRSPLTLFVICRPSRRRC